MHDTPGAAPHEYPIVVTPAHLDSLGHVNNARYFEFFEAGRTTWYEVSGLFAACREPGAKTRDTVVVNVNCDFVAECRLGETLMVATWAQRLGGKSFAVLQRLLKEDGQLSAEVVVTSVVMDLDTRKSVPLPRTLAPLFPMT
ncbi:MAG: thioesterase-3 [Gammaproteobacteria bacterium]|jgi:thioesterase-3